MKEAKALPFSDMNTTEYRFWSNNLNHASIWISTLKRLFRVLDEYKVLLYTFLLHQAFDLHALCLMLEGNENNITSIKHGSVFFMT